MTIQEEDTGLQEQSDEVSGRLIVSLILMAAMGFAAHRMRPTILRLGTAWAELTSYAVGVSMIIAVFPMTFSQVLGNVDDAKQRKQNVFLAFLSLVLSAGAVGSGVALGWLVDPDPIDEDELL